MNKLRLRLRPVDFAASLSRLFHVGIGIIGYEARAIFCPLRFVSAVERPIAFRYANNHVRSFRKNNGLLEAAGFDAFDLDPGNESFTSEWVVREAIAGVPADEARFIVDISSMSRSTMAGIFAAIMSCRKKRIEVVFTYSLAAYEGPPSSYPPLIEFGAVNSAFGGAPRGAEKYTALLLGVGYEAGRAIAAFNRLEPEVAWILLPVSEDERYNKSVRIANDDLLCLSENINALRYDVMDPVLLYEKIRTLALGLQRDHRLVFIPSGPKICALVTFLVGLDLHPDVSIWRISSGPLEPLFHRVPDGRVIALSVMFEVTE